MSYRGLALGLSRGLSPTVLSQGLESIIERRACASNSRFEYVQQAAICHVGLCRDP